MAPFLQPPPPPPSEIRSTTPIDSLPEDLLLQILLLLPPDFTYQTAKLVCRKWHKIINSDDFANSQLRRSTDGLLLQPSPELFRHWNPQRAPDRNPIYVTATGGRIQSFELSYRTKILGSCNGFVVELRHGDGNNRALSLHVTNPATKQQPFFIPPLGSKRVCYGGCGMAYSAASMVYKVALPYHDNDGAGGLYILTAGVDESWREVDVGHLSFHERKFLLRFPPIVTDGFLYWVMRRRRLLALDVDDETITNIEIPINPRTKPLLSTGRNLGAFVETEEHLWETREMVGGEWRDMAALNAALRPLKSRIHRLFPNDVGDDLWVVGWVKYPEVLAFKFEGNKHVLICYNLDTHEIDTIQLPELEMYRLFENGYRKVNQIYRPLQHRNSPVWLG